MNRRPNKKVPNARVRKTINKRKNNANLRAISQRNRARIRNNFPQVDRTTRFNSRGNSGSTLPQTVRYSAPQQVTRMNKSRIIHREPLGVLLGTQGFNVTTFNINPGLATTFPWLSPQALGYESYKFNALHIEYDHTINEFTGLGRIVMAPDYDSSDSPPTSMIQAEQMVDNVMGAVTRDWKCTLRPRGMGIIGPKRYTRSGALSANEDIKLYDIAQLHVCTSGQTTNAVEIGQLWIVYDVTLFEPQPSQSPNIFLAGQLLNTNGIGATAANLIGTTTVNEGSIVITHVNNVFTVSNLIAGFEYVMLFHLQAATITTTPSIVADNVNIVPQSSLATLNGTTTDAYIMMDFTATNTTGTFTLGGITVVTTPSFADMLIMGSVTSVSGFFN